MFIYSIGSSRILKNSFSSITLLIVTIHPVLNKHDKDDRFYHIYISIRPDVYRLNLELLLNSIYMQQSSSHYSWL